MNIIEAIKSGRRYRRPGMYWIDDYSPSDTCLRAIKPQGPDEYRPSPKDIIADDWEVEELAVSITSSQFWGAYSESQHEAMKDARMFGSLIMYPSGAHWDIVPRIARILGLRPR